MYRDNRLDTDINSKYEILYSDLRSHYIGKYLVSRNFKIFMTQIKAYDGWKKVFDNVKSQRNYISLGTDHGPGDASDTLAVYFNALEDQPDIEGLITDIIADFIKSKDSKDNFSDVLESSKVVGFKDENLAIIENAIEIHM